MSLLNILHQLGFADGRGKIMGMGRLAAQGVEGARVLFSILKRPNMKYLADLLCSCK